MARVIDITDKLNFEEKPKIAIKGQEFEVDDSATNMLKVLPKLQGDVTASTLNDIYELVFSKATRGKIDKLQLNLKDFSTVVLEAVKLINGGNGDDSGENQTPATT